MDFWVSNDRRLERAVFDEALGVRVYQAECVRTVPEGYAHPFR
jgi:hypothetical protein